MTHASELAAGQRFDFGENWSRFLRLLDDDRIRSAQDALAGMLGTQDLRGKTFLDIGSGSGLMSLAARRLGADVTSFDFDPKSVACTTELRNRYFPNDASWRVGTGSVLDDAFMATFGMYDVVYSWGVLHHTGKMRAAIQAAAAKVAPGGSLFIAIYNDQGSISRYWTAVKRIYNRSAAGRVAMIVLHFPYLFAARLLVRAATGRLREHRGMSLWYDMIDWLGGYPFEVATPQAIVELLGQLDFSLSKMTTCGSRSGCNEFVFQRTT